MKNLKNIKNKKNKKNIIWIINLILIGIILLLLIFQTMQHFLSENRQTTTAGSLTSTPQPDPSPEAESTPEGDSSEQVDKSPSHPPTMSPSAEPDVSKKSTSIAFGGDVLIHNSVISRYKADGVNGFIDTDLLQIMKAADIMMVNQEFAFTNRGEPMKDKQYTFRTDPTYVKLFHELGVDIVTLANNHTLDFGVQGLLDSCNTLEEANIKYVGAGENLEKAKEIEYMQVNGYQIAFIGASRVIPVPDWNATSTKPGMLTTYDPTVTLEQIKLAKENADYVVVYVHWGKEREEFPEQYQKNMGKQYVDAGADIVIGSHSHCLQGIEYYKGKPIVYSLGNYIFGSQSYQTALAVLTITETGSMELSLVPATATNGKTSLVSEPEKVKAFNEYMESISFGIQIGENQKVLEK